MGILLILLLRLGGVLLEVLGGEGGLLGWKGEYCGGGRVVNGSEDSQLVRHSVGRDAGRQMVPGEGS